MKGRAVPVVTTWRPTGHGRVRFRAAAAGAAVLVAALSAGCGASESTSGLPTRVPATPVAGPDRPAPPVGHQVDSIRDVRALAAMPPGSAAGAAGDDGRAPLVVQSADPPTLSVRGPDGGDVGVGTVGLPDGAGPLALVTDADDPAVLVPAPGTVIRIDLVTGATASAPVDGRAVSAVGIDGGYAVGTADGDVDILDEDLARQRTVTGFVSADSLAWAGGMLLVLDAHQTSITAVDPSTGSKRGSLRVGTGATRIIADGPDAAVAIDTDGGQMLVFGVDPLLNRQLAPIGTSPAAVAADPGRSLVWVTFTATDEVAAFDITSGEPDEKFRFPTVAFPTSLAVGPDGSVYVGSGTDGGIVRIAPEEIR